MIARPTIANARLHCGLFLLASALLMPSSVRAQGTVGPLEIQLEPLGGFLDGCFTTSMACATCHAGSEGARALHDRSGRNVAPYDLWKSSMMANAARDPLWRAMVSAEVMATPSRKQEIEAKCTRCHSPMASVEKEHAGETMGLSEIYDKDARHNQLALDGVSCTVCHQITPDNFGDPESFSGHFNISETRVAFGPHEDLFEMPMIRFTGLTPTKGDHILASELCATCHTLYTTPFAPDGSVVDARFLEQSPYLEWKNSVFASEEEASCQHCHVPQHDRSGTPISTGIARNPGGGDFGSVEDRSPFGRHIFVGGNTLVPQLLSRFSDSLQPTASSAAFSATEDLAREQLRKKTARLEIENVRESATQIEISLKLQNLCGHKFPSAHPIRRAWIHLRVEDEAGSMLFESGGYDSQFRLTGVDGEPLASELPGGPVLPHFDVITSGEQVQIYNANMQDQNGEVTHSLLRAASYRKDNRLLPRGWKPNGPFADETRPVGLEKDQNFIAGQDRILYRVPLGSVASGSALTVRVQLLYQTLSTRHEAELYEFDTPEIRDLQRMLSVVRQGPEIVDEDTTVHRR